MAKFSGGKDCGVRRGVFLVHVAALAQYHANYFEINTDAQYCQLIIEPKVEKVRKRLAELVK